jgi:hypothetical protein
VTGNEQYAAARARALAEQKHATPADPQECLGGPEALAALRELAWPCKTCGCPRMMHHLTKGGNRTHCTIAAGPSLTYDGCEKYEPAPPPEPGLLNVGEYEVSIAWRGDNHGERLVVDLLEAIEAARETGRVTWVTAPGRGRIARIGPAD